MDKRELYQIKGMTKEIEYLKRELKNAEYCIDTKMAADTVTGSSPVYPYIKHVITIAGVDTKDYQRRVKRLRNKLKSRIDELMDKVAEAEEYIATVPDSETRLILQCRFINGLTWEQIENEMHMSVATAKRKFRKWRDFES